MYGIIALSAIIAFGVVTHASEDVNTYSPAIKVLVSRAKSEFSKSGSKEEKVRVYQALRKRVSQRVLSSPASQTLGSMLLESFLSNADSDEAAFDFSKCHMYASALLTNMGRSYRDPSKFPRPGKDVYYFLIQLCPDSFDLEKR